MRSEGKTEETAAAERLRPKSIPVHGSGSGPGEPVDGERGVLGIGLLWLNDARATRDSRGYAAGAELFTLGGWGGGAFAGARRIFNGR